MNATNTKLDELREELKDPQMSEGYAESFLDSYIATQIKVLREQHKLTQQGLAELIGTRQGVISRIENVNYSKWNVTTLKKLGRAFRVRLKVSFETYGTLIKDVDEFSRANLQRLPREEDPILYAPKRATPIPTRHVVAAVERISRKKHHRPIIIRFDNPPGHLNAVLGAMQTSQQSSQKPQNAMSATTALRNVEFVCVPHHGAAAKQGARSVMEAVS